MTTSDSQEESFKPSVDRMKQELERWLEAARKAGESALERLGVSGEVPGIPIDLFEDGEKVFVLADVPGVLADQVDVTVAGNMLTLTVTRTAPVLEGFPACGHRERPIGSQTRSIPLPVAVRGEETAAQLRDGVLTLTLPKVIPMRATRVPIQTGPGPSVDPAPTENIPI
ncbi:MAG: Hsp20/alpha crystallin family protein [Planctomycetaceae bacterium]|nr:Hsp20/alpha crystallin family protein [Planctomycetaceae bacterium]